jgi:hypothetical protein
MPNYLGDQDSVTSGSNNGGYTPNTGGDTINPLVKDIVPDVDITRDIGQPLKRIKTGYYSRLDVTNSATPVLGVAVQAALSAGAVVLQNESAGFGFTSLKPLTITRISIQKSVLPTLPAPRVVKIWAEPGTLLHTGSISDVNDDGFNWYTDVSWVIPGNTAIRYATDVPIGTSIHNAPAAAYSPIFIDFKQSVRGVGFGVYPGIQGLYPAVPLGNFRYTTEPDTPITYNGSPVALLTDLTSGGASLTALQQKTQYQSSDVDITFFDKDLYVQRNFFVIFDSLLANTLVQGELRCDQKKAFFETGIDVAGGITADNLALPGFPDVDATLTAQGAAITSQADHVNLLNVGTLTHADIDTDIGQLFTDTGTLQDKTQYLSAPYRGGSQFTGPLEVNGSGINYAIRGTFFPTFPRTQTIVVGFAFTPIVSCNITSILLQKNLFVDVSTPRTVKLWIPDDPLFPGAGGTQVQSTTVSNVGGDALNWIAAVTWPITAGQPYRIGFDSIPGDFANAVAMPLDSYSSTLTIDRQSISRNPPSSGTYPNSTGVFTYTQMGNIILDAPIGGFFINNKDPLLYPSLSPLETKTQNQTAVANTTTFVNTLELKGTNTYALKASTADFEIERVGLGDVVNYNATTANVTTPIVRGLYIGPGTRPITSSGFTQTQDVTLTNSTVETTITGTGIGTLTIPANSIIVGSTSAIRGGGVIDSEGKGTETVTLRLKFNGTTAATFAVVLASNLDAGSAWTINSLAVYKAGGLRVISTVTFGNTNGQTETRNNTSLFAINTTVANTLSLTAQWNIANAANTLTLTSFVTSNLYQPLA